VELFKNVVRSDMGWRGHAESNIAYLKRSARPEAARVRDLIESWLSRYPERDNPDFITRLQSNNDIEHQAAFFELYIFTLLTSHGYEVEIHPIGDPSKTTLPDFRVSRAGVPLFFLEATSSADPTAKPLAQRRTVGRVLDAIESVESPNFFLHVEILSLGPQSPRLQPIRAAVRDGLRDLDPEHLTNMLSQSGRLDAMPSWTWSHGGWTLWFSVVPRSHAARGRPGIRTIGMGPGFVGFVESHRPLSNSVAAKAKRYGDLALPYLVAVNSADAALDDIDVGEALFGKEHILLELKGSEDPSATIGRAADGRWFGPKGPRGSRVSGVIVARGVTPWTVARTTPVLWHNPWASRRLAPEFWRLPQQSPDQLQGAMVYVSGQTAADLLGLARGWPEAASHANQQSPSRLLKNAHFGGLRLFR